MTLIISWRFHVSDLANSDRLGAAQVATNITRYMAMRDRALEEGDDEAVAMRDRARLQQSGVKEALPRSLLPMSQDT